MKIGIPVLLALAILASACMARSVERERAPAVTASGTALHSPAATFTPGPPTLTPSPAASPTATLPPTSTPTATPVPWQGYAPPTELPPTSVPPPAARLKLPHAVQVVLLLGVDNNAPASGRTDTLILAFINTENGRASLVSIPRDLYVYIPGWTMERINAAHAWGGIDLLSLSLEYNLGVRPQHWVLAHLDDFVHIVDDLGGIDIDVPVTVEDPGCPTYAGRQHLTGEYALCYVRSRITTSDFDRSRRQQEVFQEIAQQLVRMENLRNLPEWYARYHDSIQSDLGLADLVFWVPLGLRMQGVPFNKYQISWEQTASWRVPGTNAAVLLPNREKVTQVLQEALDAALQPAPERTDLESLLAELTATPESPEE